MDETVGEARGTELGLGKQIMLKLYRRTGETLHYHEAWHHDGVATEHWGIVGEQGESREHALSSGVDADEAVIEVLRPAVESGFEPVDDLAVLLIEYVIDGFGTPEQFRKRHALQERMDDVLGWTGLGHCDGGSTGSGTMEVCCYVVDFDIAKRVIEADLKGTEFGDYSRVFREGVDGDE